jgi:GAF domain-containing protein
VADVDAFPGHIACDSRSRSEIVVPVFGADGALMGVFDADSTELAAFDEDDAAGLEAILAATFGAQTLASFTAK